MAKSVPIRVSEELREALGKLKFHDRESYDALLRRKLKLKRKLRATPQTFPHFTPGKATKKVLNSDKGFTKEFF